MIGGLSKAARHRATQARDKKYDGIFYFAIANTGFYCRPSCTLPRPLHKRYVFFDTVQKAEAHHYRPCTHCHPSRLKGNRSIEILDNINTGALAEKGICGLANALHVSERHLRRLVHDRTGTSPTTLKNVKRVNTAEALILQTNLPITEIAYRADFTSLRQFNSIFKKAFKISPREMRKAALQRPRSIITNN